MQKKIALLHRYPDDQIKETNAAFPFLKAKGIDVLTFKTFKRLNSFIKFWKSIFWILYSPFLVLGKGYDVIYCDDSYPFYPALVKLASPKSKIVLRIGDLHLMYMYSGPVYKLLHFFEKMVWRMADQIIAISSEMAGYISKESQRRVCIVPDPVDPEDFKVIKTYNGGSVMFHGVITRNKNVDVLIEAAKILKDVDFIVIGEGPDLKRLMKKAPSNVHFQGWVPFRKIKEYIATCSIGVALRSDNPGNDYVVTSPFLQYGVMGKPCLVTRRKVFGNYKWQFTGAQELADKIKVLLKRPQEGAKLRKYILENHSAPKIAEEIWQILKQP